MNNKIHNPIDKSSHASNILIIQATLIKRKINTSSNPIDKSSQSW